RIQLARRRAVAHGDAVVPRTIDGVRVGDIGVSGVHVLVVELLARRRGDALAVFVEVHLVIVLERDRDDAEAVGRIEIPFDQRVLDALHDHDVGIHVDRAFGSGDMDPDRDLARARGAYRRARGLLGPAARGLGAITR